ncbi:MAG: single-stranded DNA-binding protein [Luteitalea sp.]|nr:single-stranded DNA-binding protein [Luteitalea sp.]
MNQVALAGNITDDPELRYTQRGPRRLHRRGQPPLQAQRAVAGRQRRLLPLHCVALGRQNASRTLRKGMRVFVAGKLVQRTRQDDSGNKRQTVEIQVTHVGPDLQFATAEVTKSTAEGSQAPAAAAG